jgi:hypothetical protein
MNQLLDMSMKRFGIPQNIELESFSKRACQHMVHANGFLFVNNATNNVNVYKLN